MTEAVAKVAAVLAAGIATIPMPERKTARGSKPQYLFADLAVVGQAFGVKNKTAKQLNSIVGNANRRFIGPVLDANGKPTFETKELKGADGSVTNVPDTSKPITGPDRHFFVVDVDADLKAKIKGTPLEGSTALVFRDK